MLHAGAAVYVTDIYGIDPVLQVHGHSMIDRSHHTATTDSSVWFHRPIRADGGTCWNPQSPAAARLPGVMTGRLFDADGKRSDRHPGPGGHWRSPPELTRRVPSGRHEVRWNLRRRRQHRNHRRRGGPGPPPSNRTASPTTGRRSTLHYDAATALAVVGTRCRAPHRTGHRGGANGTQPPAAPTPSPNSRTPWPPPRATGSATLGIGLSHKVVIENMFGLELRQAGATPPRDTSSVLMPLSRNEPANRFDGEVYRVIAAVNANGSAGFGVVVAALGEQMLRVTAALSPNGNMLTWCTGPATLAARHHPDHHRSRRGQTASRLARPAGDRRAAGYGRHHDTAGGDRTRNPGSPPTARCPPLPRDARPAKTWPLARVGDRVIGLRGAGAGADRRAGRHRGHRLRGGGGRRDPDEIAETREALKGCWFSPTSAHTPMPPSSFHTATIDGRAVPLPPSGQFESGSSMLLSSCSPGCWTETVTRSSSTIGPQVSAPIGTVRNCRVSPRLGPSRRRLPRKGRHSSRGRCRRWRSTIAVFVEREVVGTRDRADLGLSKPPK